MKITIFTGNQPRHISFIRDLAAIADEVYAVQECTTLFPGAVQDSIYQKSPLMKEYFERVLAAEHDVFGDAGFLPAHVRSLAIKMGDVSHIPMATFGEALSADAIIVFGASYIKGALADALIAKRAVNIHMGVSPYYRGSSCNFWAIQDGHPELVGATIHLLSKGLDSGQMLFHALPKPQACDPFVFGMKAVKAAHVALCRHIQNNTFAAISPVAQDKTKQIRYSRYADFNDAVVAAYLPNVPTIAQLQALLDKNQGRHALHNPVFV